MSAGDARADETAPLDPGQKATDTMNSTITAETLAAIAPSLDAAVRAPTPTHAGASITVHVGRDTIDPQGLGSDEECATCEKHILDAVRTAFPGADVRAVGNGGRTSATMRDSTDFTDEVKAVVTRAFDDYSW